jgi:hypothetical protein
MASTVTAATKLTIQRSEIGDVSNVSSTGQTIPMVIGIALVVVDSNNQR